MQRRTVRLRMLKRVGYFWFVLTIILPFIPSSLHAQQSAVDSTRADSTRADSTADTDNEMIYDDGSTVIVTASRIYDRMSTSTRAITVIGREQIAERGGNDLGDIVATAPGVFVKRYGGLGGLETISLRGTTAGQTAILIDGLPYRSNADGSLDLSSLPASAIEEVEVIRGGDAALYGGGSVGGAINIVTRKGGGGSSLRLDAGAGSFGERSGEIAAATSTDIGRFDLGLSYSRTDGDYPFRFREFGEEEELRRENGSYRNLFGTARWYWKDKGGWSFGLSGQGYLIDRGVPGSVVQGNREQLEATINEKELLVRADAAGHVGIVDLVLRGSGRTNRLHYRDPEGQTGGPNGIDQSYDRNEGFVAATGMMLIGGETWLRGSGELEYAALQGDNLDPAVGGDVERIRSGGMIQISRFIRDLPFNGELNLDAGGRFDLFNDRAAEVAPSIGLIWRPTPQPLRFRLHASFNYRAPNFSEQYYLNFGNSNLRTEHSRSLTAGTTWLPFERVLLEGSLFLIDTDDRIIAIPRSPVSWSAQNIGHVRSRGLELGATTSFLDDHLSTRLSYTLMESRDRTEGITFNHLLPYAPQELFNGSITISAGRFSLTGGCEYVSHRPTLAYNTPESALPRYALFDLGLGGSHTFGPVRLTGRIQGKNIFDADYQVVRNYPMPGWSVSVRFGVEWERRNEPVGESLIERHDRQREGEEG